MGEESQYGKEKYMKLTKNAEVRQYDDKKGRRISRKKGGLLVHCVCVCVWGGGDGCVGNSLAQAEASLFVRDEDEVAKTVLHCDVIRTVCILQAHQ